MPLTNRLTDAEFWALNGLLSAHRTVHDLLGVTEREMCDAIWPGTDEATLARVRDGLRKFDVRKTAPMKKKKAIKAHRVGK